MLGADLQLDLKQGQVGHDLLRPIWGFVLFLWVFAHLCVNYLKLVYNEVMDNREPTTLLEVVTYFSDEKRALDHFVSKRWPNGVACPRCGCLEPHYIATRMIWRCNGCKQQFSAKVGTIFEDSPIKLSKWLPAMWLIANCKNGISSYELARGLKVTQKTAWFMLHRIRLAMRSGTFEKLTGQVEADETYIGGQSRFMHYEKRVSKSRSGGAGKTMVMGALQRGGGVRLKIAEKADQKTVKAFIFKHVDGHAHLYTDNHSGYSPMGFYFTHLSVNHAVEYVRGRIHTNSMENFWSLLKRTVKGTYVCPSPWHLYRYCEEQAFRFNTRKDTDGGRFDAVLSQVTGKRLTYATLTGKEPAAGWTTLVPTI